ncbi:hypothetical protein E4U55_004532 [Claviceps digitariae]|nr:hypothetical protein E4U55_004532 [Claviceps digitariae]
MDVNSSSPSSHTPHDAAAAADQQALSSSSSSPPPPTFDSAFSTTSHFFFYHTIDPSTGSLTSNILGPNLTTTFTHSRAPALFSQAAILGNLTKKTTGFLAFLSHSQPSTTPTRTILAWAESGHGHGPEGDLLDANPSVLPNTLWAKRVIKLSSIMGLNLGHPFDRLTRGGQQGIFRASHVEVKLATHAIYTLLRMFNIPHRGEALTPRTLERLRWRTRQAGRPANNVDAAGGGGGGSDQDGCPRPSFEIYFSKKNCHACAMYVARLSALTGVDMALCWRDRLVQIEYGVTRMGEPRLLDGQADEQQAQGVITVEDDDDDQEDQSDDQDMRMLDMVDLTEQEPGSSEMDEPHRGDDDAPRLGTFLEGLAYCIGQGTRTHVVKAVVELARIWRHRRSLPRRSSLHSSAAAGRTTRRGNRRGSRQRGGFGMQTISLCE